MKANELRIGNIVKQGTVKSFYENGIHIGDGKTFNFSEAEPIPLTEEWLLKFRFKKESNSYECGIYNLNLEFGEFYLRPSYSGGYYWGFDNDNEINNQRNIEHLHQLQNLIFILTNKELTIK